MTPDMALAALEALADPARAPEMARHHKAQRRYLGIANPVLNDLASDWRKSLSLEQRLTLARALWDSGTHEGRIAAAKLLTQARIRPDEDAWALIASWVPQFDGWAVADHACSAGGRRLMALPERLEQVEHWTRDDSMWVRRAALVMTLPWAKLPHPSADQLAQRERILGWAAGYVADRDWFIQKAVAWWLRDLSKHDPDRVAAFLDTHGTDMKAFALKEAGKYLRPDQSPNTSNSGNSVSDTPSACNAPNDT